MRKDRLQVEKSTVKIKVLVFFIVTMSIFYAIYRKHFVAAMLLLGLLIAILQITGAQSIGVCYGGTGNANNLPPEQDTVDLYKTNSIGRMRIYDPYPEILNILNGSNIELMLGVANSNLQALASDASAAANWVEDNLVNYPNIKFRYIAVGNEVQHTDAEAQYVLLAMQNIYSAISSAGLKDQIKVSTAIDLRLLDLSNISPPSRGSFNESARSYIDPIIAFQVSNGAPLLASVYPYFTYINNMQTYQLSYALFNATGIVEEDGDLGYQNLFDALLDALYSAVEKAGGVNLEIVVSESGWPSDGGTAATVDNAGTYYMNLINHVKGPEGTPKKPGRAIETYLFSMFDENLKSPEIEKHFGLFYPDQRLKYPIIFS